MRERPILFNGAMVRALLSGAKTQTRRVMRPQPEATSAEYPKPGHTWPSKAHQTMLHVEDEMQKWTGLAGHACPFGQTGDRLWVRESFADMRGTVIEHRPDPAGPMQRYAYAADTPAGTAGDYQRREYGIKWRPSIHMPRDACRLVLEITAVRVERLQAITEADAIAEGATAWAGEQNTPIRDLDTGDERIAFMAMWNRAGGDWDSNPWVWVIEFKRVEVAGG